MDPLVGPPQPELELTVEIGHAFEAPAGQEARLLVAVGPLHQPFGVHRQLLGTAVIGSDFVSRTTFHPLNGEEYELVGFTHTWGEHRVFFRKPGDQRVYSVPASWTDVEGPDPFVVLSAGRSLFRLEDLFALSGLIQELSQRGCK